MRARTKMFGISYQKIVTWIDILVLAIVGARKRSEKQSFDSFGILRKAEISEIHFPHICDLCISFDTANDGYQTGSEHPNCKQAAAPRPGCVLKYLKIPWRPPIQVSHYWGIIHPASARIQCLLTPIVGVAILAGGYPVPNIGCLLQQHQDPESHGFSVGTQCPPRIQYGNRKPSIWSTL